MKRAKISRPGSVASFAGSGKMVTVTPGSASPSPGASTLSARFAGWLNGFLQPIIGCGHIAKMLMKVHFHTFLLLLSLSAFVQAQQLPSPSPSSSPPAAANSAGQSSEEIGEGEVLRISSNLVSVPVSVINRQGQYVVDLQKQDFRVFEDGKEQPIVHFSNVDQPFSVVLLIDTSGSTAPFIDQNKAAAKAFVDQMRPAD